MIQYGSSLAIITRTISVADQLGSLGTAIAIVTGTLQASCARLKQG